MPELRKSLGALSLAGALLLAIPAVASAAHRPMEGDGGRPNPVSQSSTGHADHNMGKHAERGRDHWDRGARFAGFDDYTIYAAHDGGCRYYRHMWRETGRRIWLRRYDRCMWG